MGVKAMAIAIALDKAKQQVIVSEQEIWQDINLLACDAQRIHDYLASEIEPRYAMIQAILIMVNDDDGFPRVARKLRGNSDYEMRVI